MRIVYPILIAIFAVLMLFFAWQSFKLGLFKTEEKVISNHQIVLEKIEELGNLELVKYKFRDVLEHKIEYDWWPDSKAILIIAGEAIGCVNLKQIKEDDIIEKTDTLYIRLPKPVLCGYKINHKDSKVYHTTSYSRDESKMLDQAFKAAEKQIKQTALKSNILEQAGQNAEKLLKPVFEQISQKKVVFIEPIDEKEGK